MIKDGKFNTDAPALKQRIQTHEKYGQNDLNKWIFEHMDLRARLCVLDLGCGIGKQTLPIAQSIGPSGQILAIDVSQEALNILSKSSKESGLERQITLLCIGLDDIKRHLPEQHFDRAVASYSLYYAQHPSIVFKAVHRTLKDGGIFFFCGPAKDNNLELKRFHYALRGEQLPLGTEAALFMEESGKQLACEYFTRVDIFKFENPLNFDSAKALYTYWSSHNLYDENLDVEFKNACEVYFRDNSVFKTTKRVIGIRALK